MLYARNVQPETLSSENVTFTFPVLLPPIVAITNGLCANEDGYVITALPTPEPFVVMSIQPTCKNESAGFLVVVPPICQLFASPPCLNCTNDAQNGFVPPDINRR